MKEEFENPYESYQMSLKEEEMAVDLSLSRMRPFDHQVRGVQSLVHNPIFALFDEMGIGKTKQIIDAAQALYTDGKIHQVIVVCPGSVRSVWYDENFGELKKHLWNGLPARVVQYHKHTNYWSWNVEDTKESYLRFVITNYEFIRREERLLGVLDFCDTETMLVLDESSCIKSPRAKQTKACLKLREHCGRVVLLNGTPISHSPRDMYAQGLVMDKKILDCKSYDAFKNKYMRKMGAGKYAKVQWVFIEDIQERFSPYVLRRLKKDCLDLPEKMDPVTLTVPLDEKTWLIYQQLKNEFMVWLNQEAKEEKGGQVLKAQQAIVKALRLSQLCGGFLGGIEQTAEIASPEEQQVTPEMLEQLIQQGLPTAPKKTQEIGREKLDLFMEWLDVRLQEDEHFKLLVWCRFRAELNRIVREVEGRYKKVTVAKISGGQTREERDAAVGLLNPDTAPARKPVVVVGSPQAGGMGLNMAAAHTVVYYSNDHSLKTRLQSEDRTHRPGQIHAVSYFDIVATGPNGQKTMDHTVLRSLREKEDLANWTTEAWIESLGG